MRRMKAGTLVIAAYLTVCLVWGSTYLAIRVGVRDLPPFLFAGARHLLAGLFLAVLCAASRQPFPRGWRSLRGHGLVGLFMLAGGNGLVVWAEQWVNSGVTAILLAMVPLFTAWLGVSLHGDRIGVRGWLGIPLGLAGVALLIGPSAPMGNGWFLGSLVILLGSFSWALGSVLAKRIPPSEALLPGVAVQMLVGGLVLCLVGLSLGQASAVRITESGLASLAYLIFCGSLLGYSAYVYLLRHMPAARAATYAYVNPAVAVILGALILREQVTERVLLSLPMILGGVLLVQYTGRRRASAKKAVPG